MPLSEPPYDLAQGQIVRAVNILGGSVGRPVVVRSGADLHSEDYVAATSGWIIKADGTVEFESGFFRGNISGASGTFAGELIGGELHIPDKDTTANSIHADDASDPIFWIGATNTNKATAPFRVTAAGVVTATSGTFTGTVNASTGTLTDLTVNGDITMTSGGQILTSATGRRAILTEGSFVPTGYPLNMAGMQLYAGHPTNEDEPGYVAAYDGTTSGVLYVVSPDYGGGQAAIQLESTFTDNNIRMDTDRCRVVGNNIHGGLDIGDVYSASYIGIKTGSQSRGTEYALLTDGVHTFLSAGSSGSLYLRAGGNSSTNQVLVNTSGTTISGWLTVSDGFTRLARSTGGAEVLRLVYDGAANIGGYITFWDGAETDRLGYIGYPSNDDLWINNEEAAGHVYIQCGASSQLHMRVGGAEKFRIGGNGLDSGAARGWSFNTLNAGEIHVQKSGATDGITVWYSDEGTAGQTKVIFEANGDITNRTNSYTGISDERGKSNIKEYRDPTDDLMAMQVISYDRTHFLQRQKTGRIVRRKDGIGRHEIGWGAQSIAKIKPGFVKENPETTELAVKTSLFIPLLHRGFQIHNDRLDAYDTRIAALEEKMNA